ncbi:MAG: GNAT family N-acetyltransferase [Comamonas sp.]
MQKNLQIAGQQLELRDMVHSDMGDVLALHHQVFSSSARSDWFEWKYVQGHGEGVGIWNDQQQLIAYCGGFPRRVLQQGAAADFLQIGDLMVSPEWRGVFTRKNPFFYACEHLYTTRLGNDRPFKVGFGFAHARSTRLHVRQGLGRDGGMVPYLQWQVAQRLPLPGPQWLWKVAPLAADALRATVDRAWQAMRRETQQYTIGIRDADYVAWRFTQRPDKPYRLFTLRRIWDLQPLGVIVLSQPSHPGEAVQWMDWIGPARHLAHACLAALRIAAQEGAPTMTTWASAAVTELLAATEPGFLPHIANISIRAPADMATQAPDLKLWLMAGDTDFL